MTSPDWLLDERGSAGRENLDAGHVDRYDSKMDARAADEVAALRDLGLDSSALVIDLGSGTGQFTMAAAAVADHVVAVDVSDPMRSALEHKLRAAGVDNVTVVDAGFLTYEHELRPADVVYSRLALHHLPDFWKGVALRRIRSWMTADAVLRLVDAIYHFDPADATVHLEAWAATGRDVPAGTELSDGWGRWEVAEHIRDEHSTYSWILDELIDRAGLRVETVSHDTEAMMSTYTIRRR